MKVITHNLQTERQTVIDVLKGICIIFVIIAHCGWNERQRLLGLFPYIIDMAVPVFMIVSGYVFSNSYINKGITQFEKAYDLSIISKRIIRYTIPFVMAYIIELIWFYAIGKELKIVSIVSVFFTGGYGPGSYYYPEMIQITFILPIILFSMSKSPKTGLLFWFSFNAFYEFIKTIVGLDQDIYRLSVFRYTFLLACGCYIFLRKQNRFNKTFLRVSFIIGFIFIFVTKYLGYQTKIINNDWKGTSFMSALYIAPIVMTIIYKYGAFSFKPLEIVGKASYNIFLTQLVFYATIAGSITQLTDKWYPHVVINVIVCVFVGIVFYLVENRITNKIIIWLTPIINKINLYLRK